METRVVLVDVAGAYNLGLIARLCDNFEADELRIVSTQNGRAIPPEAYRFASNSQDTLKQAGFYSSLSDSLSDSSFNVATSAVISQRGPSIVRRAIDLASLKEKLAHRDLPSLSLVFGRESSGLTTAEVEECDLLVKVETSLDYGTLNVACAVAIVLHAVCAIPDGLPERQLASADLRGRILDEFRVLSERAINNSGRERKANLALENVLNRGSIGDREATLILGVLRKATSDLEHPAREGAQ